MMLLASFNHPATDARHALRRIHKAMSEPGVIVSQPLQHGWGPLSPAAASALLALLGRGTPLWLDPALDDEALRAEVRLHTGATTTNDDAPFALLRADSPIDLARFSAGNRPLPMGNATLIIEASSLRGGLTLRLHNPGSAESRAIAPRLPAQVVRYLCEHPRSADLLFTCGEMLLALPHTTQVEVY